jgi:hypothetical protein
MARSFANSAVCRSGYSRLGVRGPVLPSHHPQPPLTSGADLQAASDLSESRNEVAAPGIAAPTFANELRITSVTRMIGPLNQEPEMSCGPQLRLSQGIDPLTSYLIFLIPSGASAAATRSISSSIVGYPTSSATASLPYRNPRKSRDKIPEKLGRLLNQNHKYQLAQAVTQRSPQVSGAVL